MNRTLKIISLALMTTFVLASATAQAWQQQSSAPKAQSQGGTPGRIVKFTGTRTTGDSNITDDGGKIGIGTTLPTSMLTVNGIIEMMGAQAGIKFPDGTLQTTAGLSTVFRDDTLKGNGAQSAPLGVAVPLRLSGGSILSSVLEVSVNTQNSIGLRVNGGSHGTAVIVQGGLGSRGALIAGGSQGGPGITVGGGENDSGVGGIGVEAGGGLSSSTGGIGIRAVGGSGNGVGNSGGVGIEAVGGNGSTGATRGLAGRFFGDVQVTGVLSKASGSFKIDHPLDPENKYLSHSFVESPDMMNIYNGNVTTDHSGLAVVELPGYFDSLNRDFRYQLTVVGQFAQAIIAEEVKDNRFTIQSSAPGVKVSWQVTGIRQDAWANQNRIKVEQSKSELERGHYLHPEAFGKGEERGVEGANHPEQMPQIKQHSGAKRFER